MSIELTLLVWSVGLTFVQMLVYTVGAAHLFGLPKLAGNREDLPSAAGWVGRAGRAHRNMLENLLLFAILVLVAEITDKNDAMTGLGSQLFFWGKARLCHYLCRRHRLGADDGLGHIDRGFGHDICAPDLIALWRIACARVTLRPVPPDPAPAWN